MKPIEIMLSLFPFREGDVLHYRAFTPESRIIDPNDNGVRLASAPYPTIPAKLDQWASEGRSVHWLPHIGGTTKSAIKFCTALFIEHDSIPRAESAIAWRRIPGMPPPTFQIHTGSDDVKRGPDGKVIKYGSIHSYWVFSLAMPVADWERLQFSLLTELGADLGLQKATQPMRCPGYPHPTTGRMTEFIPGSGERYSFDQLDRVIPHHVATSAVEFERPTLRTDVALHTLPNAANWTEFERNFRLPLDRPVPLEICLARSTRSLIEKGVGEGQRNQVGAAVVRDLIGTEAILAGLGQSIQRSSNELFDDFCNRCSPPIAQRERDAIFKSGLKSGPTPCLPNGFIEACIRSWAWKEERGTQGLALAQPYRSIPTPSINAPDPVIPPQASEAEALEIEVKAYADLVDSGATFPAILYRKQLTQKWGLTRQEIESLANVVRASNGKSMVVLLDSMADVYYRIEETSQDLPGISTGFWQIDSSTLGLQSNKFWILAARPSMGKSLLALNIAANVAKQGHPTAFFSLEMSHQDQSYRILSSLSGLNSIALKRGQVEDREWPYLAQALAIVADWPFYYDDSPGLTFGEIAAKARQIKAEHGSIGLVVVDYLQIVTHSGDGQEVQELSKITRAAKKLAGELGCTVIMLSQLSRAVESRKDKHPVLSDLRDSGAIEQDADTVLMLYRDEYYNPESEYRGLADLGIVKNRDGATGKISLLFEPQASRFCSVGR